MINRTSSSILCQLAYGPVCVVVVLLHSSHHMLTLLLGGKLSSTTRSSTTGMRSFCGKTEPDKRTESDRHRDRDGNLGYVRESSN
jgi:hypothetical protein